MRIHDNYPAGISQMALRSHTFQLSETNAERLGTLSKRSAAMFVVRTHSHRDETPGKRILLLPKIVDKSQWQADAEVSKCDCGDKFTIFRRKHHW
jgi:hypothetical protein